MSKPSALETEIALIEKFFKDYGLWAMINKAASFVAGRSFAVLALHLGAGVRISSLESRMPELSEVLSSYRGKATPVRLRRLPLSIEVPHPKAEPLFPTWENLHIPAHCMLAGKSYGYNGAKDEIIDLDREPHVLVAGTTGSGKSRLLELLIYSLALNTSPADARLVFVDLKNEDLVQFANLPHTDAMALSLDDAIEQIYHVHSVKDYRVLSGAGKYRRMILVIDELAELSTSKGAMDRLARSLAIGRSKNINVIAATQKPTAKIVGSVAKANFTVRLVGKVLSPSDAEVAAGMSGSGAHFLPGNGSFLNVKGDRMDRFQAYLLTDAPELALLRQEQKGVTRAEVQQAVHERWIEQAVLPLAVAV